MGHPVGLSEQDSRGIPHSQAEVDWAHNRPARHRVRTPAVGDTVLYRHDPWTEPTEATVAWVQPADDVDDPHLWQVQADGAGRIVTHEDRPLMTPRPDPWPVLRLRTRYGMVETREARLRGSPGWLPPDWQARHRPVPELARPMSGAVLRPRPVPGPA